MPLQYIICIGILFQSFTNVNTYRFVSIEIIIYVSISYVKTISVQSYHTLLFLVNDDITITQIFELEWYTIFEALFSKVLFNKVLCTECIRTCGIKSMIMFQT